MITETLFNAENITANSPQIEKLKALFPNCFDTSGRFLLENFQAEISDHAEISREFYSMNWLGKSYAKLLRNLPPETLLAEDVEHNAKPENSNSENLLIQGDNLEVLKHLKNAYVGEIKMIYIDPPYNTGSDGFIYHDDRKFTPEQLAKLANIGEEEAARIIDFTAKKSNSHSAWLTFMYPRLYVARELLREDGVIFISIDDNEAAQLKLLCDEVFGEGNFVADFIVRSNPRGSQSSKFIAIEHESILCYAKSKEINSIIGFSKNDDDISEYNLNDELGKYRLLGLRQRGGAWKREDRPDMYYPIYIDTKTGEVALQQDAKYTKETLPHRPNGDEGRWTWGKKKFVEETHLLVGKKVNRDGNEDFWDIFRKDYLHKNGEIAKSKPRSIFDEKEMNYQNGGNEIKTLFGSSEIFKYPKPTSLIKKLAGMLEITADDLILDFFAGSGTTAHAVMQLNAEDGGDRKFICVQIAEKTAEKSEAFQAGYKTIFDITKARIEKAAEKIVGADFISARNNDTETIRADIKSAPTKNFGFKIYKTVENFCAVSDADFSPEHEELPLFTYLNDEQRRTLLTTWALADGAKLNEKITDIRLGNYVAYLCEKRLYLLNEGLTSADLLAFIQKLDHDAEFNPNRVILLGSAIESRLQKELDQALATYANRKNIAISLIVRN